MGEAKRRKLLEQSGAGAAVPQINQDFVGKAVRQVVGAITSAPAADCTIYALTGAELLRLLGVKAEAVAGSAIWRVGPGDGDVVNHAPEVRGQAYAPTTMPGKSAAMYHAWIRIDSQGIQPSQLVDLTTFQLRKKGRELDAIDGGTTQVDFCPDSIWAPESRHAYDPRRVNQSYDVGVFAYVRKSAIEPLIFNEELRAEARTWGQAALIAYRHLEAGTKLVIMGVEEDGTVSAPDEDKPLNLRRVTP